jgi:hypothetical protein
MKKGQHSMRAFLVAVTPLFSVCAGGLEAWKVMAQVCGRDADHCAHTKGVKAESDGSRAAVPPETPLD